MSTAIVLLEIHHGQLVVQICFQKSLGSVEIGYKVPTVNSTSPCLLHLKEMMHWLRFDGNQPLHLSIQCSWFPATLSCIVNNKFTPGPKTNASLAGIVDGATKKLSSFVPSREERVENANFDLL